jgi:hypothetical protein
LFTSFQLPLILAAFAVGWGALVVFSIRRRAADIELASGAYVFVLITFMWARS